MSVSAAKPILIAGPTASGKSALALKLAEATGRTVVNADALQVYDCWSVLSARPDARDLQRAPHALYGHVSYELSYSVGAWLKDLSDILENTRELIVVGGTGLYLTALTEGLSDIPATPDARRAQGNALMQRHGIGYFRDYLRANDPDFLAGADEHNHMRLQRAWEVQEETGTSMSQWHRKPRRPLLPLAHTVPLRIDAAVPWLNARIESRFAQMLESGAVEEVARLREVWNPDLPASRALGAAEIMRHLNGEITLDEAVRLGAIATRQFAKRQRTWLRSNMGDWHGINPETMLSDESIRVILQWVDV